MARSFDEHEIRTFLSHGTRTGKLAWTAASGQPHVAPIWFVLGDGPALELVFTTGADTAKGRALHRDPRVSLVVDDERPPFAFVKLTGEVSISEDLDEVRTWATRIGARYMGAGPGRGVRAPQRRAGRGARPAAPEPCPRRGRRRGLTPVEIGGLPGAILADSRRGSRPDRRMAEIAPRTPARTGGPRRDRSPALDAQGTMRNSGRPQSQRS